MKIACEARRLFRPEPRPGIDPGTSILPRWRSTTELSGQRDKTLPTNDQKAKSLDSFMINLTRRDLGVLFLAFLRFGPALFLLLTALRRVGTPTLTTTGRKAGFWCAAVEAQVEFPSCNNRILQCAFLLTGKVFWQFNQ